MKVWTPQAFTRASLGLLFTIFYLISTRQGNLETQDSLHYLAIAKHISGGVGLYDASGEPLTYWPPLYPLILSLGIHQPYTFVFLLHLFGMWGVIFLWLLIAERILKRQAYQLLYGGYVVTSTPLLMIATFIWSETLFLLFFSAYLYFLCQFIHTHKNKWLFIAAVPGFLMLLQRNAGIFLVGGVVLGLFISGIHKKNYKYLLLHFGLVISGSLYWNVNRLLVDQHVHVLGELIPKLSPVRNLKLVLGELAVNFLPLPLLAPLGITCILLILIAFGWFWRKGYVTDPFLFLLFVVVVTYLATWLVIPADQDDISRFMSLILPPFYLIFMVNVQIITQLLGESRSKIIYVIVMLGLLYPLIRVIHNAMHWGGIKPFVLVKEAVRLLENAP